MIYDGNLRDTTDRTEEKFLFVNSCGYQKNKADYTVQRKKGRKDYHILFMTHGKGQVLHGGKMHPLTSGSVVIYAPGEEQMYTFSEESTSLWCHFGGYAVKEIFSEENVKSGVYRLKNIGEITEIFSDMIRYFYQPSAQKYAVAECLKMLYKISDGNEKSVSRQEQLLPALSYININYGKKIDVEYLADLTGYSKSYFAHMFSLVMGVSPLQYVNGKRLRIAQDMLASTKLTMQEIALQVGFEDPLYFSRLFKGKFNISPAEYRKAKKQADKFTCFRLLTNPPDFWWV